MRLLSAGSASPMERVAELIPQALESIKKMDEDEERERSPQVAGGISGMRRARARLFVAWKTASGRPALTRV